MQNSFAQTPTHEINISSELETSLSGFIIKEVIDARQNKEHIGYVNRGGNDKKHIANYPDSFSNYLLQTLNNFLPTCEDCPELIVVIHKHLIYEVKSQMHEYAIFKLEMEFLLEEDGIYYSLGYEQSLKRRTAIDVTRKHSKNIQDGLLECLKSFQGSNWQDKKEIEREPPFELKLDVKKLIKDGLYANYFQLCFNTPFQDTGFTLIQRGRKKITKFYIYEDIINLVSDKVFLIVKNGDFYLKASEYNHDNGTRFVKSKLKGRYLLFYDKINDPGAASLLFGLTGVIVNNALELNSRTLIVYDTLTDKIILLNDSSIEKLLSNHSSLLKKYKDSKKRNKDKEDVIRFLNKIDAE